MIRLLIFLIAFIFPCCALAEEKIIEVPSEMTVEMILANDDGMLNGNYDVRARIYDPVSRRRVWFENFPNHPIENGALVLVMNSIPSLNAYELHLKELKLVVTAGTETAVVPLLTELYSYRSLFSEFGWATRFPNILFIDRVKNQLGIGTQLPKAPLDVNGALKLAYEDTEVTGAIRWSANSLRVRHPSGWVDLLYSNESFQASRWTDAVTNIQLTSKNYLIGIGTKYPTEKLQVNGNAYFDGQLTATNVVANQYAANQFQLSSLGLNASQLMVFNSPIKQEWTNDNLIVQKVVGNGSGLTNVGELKQDFSNNIIQERHLVDDVISSRNLITNTIDASHLALENIQKDRLVESIFNGALLADNSINSDNIIESSLSFDVLQDNDLVDYISNGFFDSNVIASESIYNIHFQDHTITSADIQANSLDATHLASDIVRAGHIADDQVTITKIKTGEINSSLFSGVLPITGGGTGVSSIAKNRVMIYSNNVFSPNGSVYINDNGNIGFYDSNTLTSIDYNFQDRMVVGSLLNNVSVKIDQPAASALQIPLKNSQDNIMVDLTNTGALVFRSGSNNLFVLQSDTVISRSLASNQANFDLGAAIQIGRSENSAGNAGTIEYRSDTNSFRFHDGTDWETVSDVRHGLGSPFVVDSDYDNNGSTVLAQLTGSSIRAESSFLPRVSNSHVHGAHILADALDQAIVTANHTTLQLVQHSNVSANQATLSHVQSSELAVDDSIASRILDSTINAKKSHLFDIKDSVIAGDQITAMGLDLVQAKSQSATLQFVSDAALIGDKTDFVRFQRPRLWGMPTILSMRQLFELMVRLTLQLI